MQLLGQVIIAVEVGLSERYQNSKVSLTAPVMFDPSSGETMEAAVAYFQPLLYAQAKAAARADLDDTLGARQSEAKTDRPSSTLTEAFQRPAPTLPVGYLPNRHPTKLERAFVQQTYEPDDARVAADVEALTLPLSRPRPSEEVPDLDGICCRTCGSPFDCECGKFNSANSHVAIGRTA